MAIEHSNLPNAQLHEPKDVSAATAGQVYVADGGGSGAWTQQASSSSVTIDVEDASDFPVPIADVITLAPNCVYVLSGQIDVGNDRFVFSEGSILQGIHRTVSGITSTTTGVLFTGSGINMRMEHLTLDASSCTQLYDFNGSGTKVFSARDMLSITHPAMVGTLTDALNIIVTFSVYAGGTGGFLIAGSNTGNVIVELSLFAGFTATAIDLGTAIMTGIGLDGILFEGTGASDVAVAGLTDSDNIAIGGTFSVRNCDFVDTTTALVGITVDDIRFRFTDNAGLPDTHKEAQGYVVASAETTAISGSQTPVLLDIGTAFVDSTSRQFEISTAGRLTYIGADETTFHLQGAIQGTGSSGTNTFNIYFAKNGTIIPSTQAGRVFTSTADSNLMNFGLVSLSQDDYIELWIENDGATTDFECVDLNILARG